MGIETAKKIENANPESTHNVIEDKLRGIYESSRQRVREILGSLNRANPLSLVEQLRTLQQIQLQNKDSHPNSISETTAIVQKLYEYLDSIEQKIARGQANADEVRQYSEVIDQMAISLPLEDLRKGKGQEIQMRGLRVLTLLHNQSPTSTTARAIFMIYHHGAGIPNEIERETFEKFLRGEKPSVEYGLAIIQAERNGEKYLSEYATRVLELESIYLDDKDIQKFSNPTDEQKSCLLDISNFHRRIGESKRMANQIGKEDLRLAERILIFLAAKDKQFEGSLSQVRESINSSNT